MLENITHPADVMLSIVTGTIGSMGIPGNLFLMVLIASEYKSRKPHDWLFFQLALGDFLLCINNGALEGPFIVNPTRVECKVAGAMEYCLGLLSFLAPPLVAYNRYVSLYNSDRYKKLFTNRNVVLMYGAVAGFCIVWASMFVINGALEKEDVGLCGAVLKNFFLRVNMVLGCLVIFAMYTALVYFSYKVILKIHQHKKAVAGRSGMQSKLINESQEIITALLLCSVLPLFAQIPCAVVKFYQVFFPFFDPWVSRTACSPFPLTSTLNAYVTMYVVKIYRKSVISLFKKGTFAVTVGKTLPTGQLTQANNVAQQPGKPKKAW